MVYYISHASHPHIYDVKLYVLILDRHATYDPEKNIDLIYVIFHHRIDPQSWPQALRITESLRCTFYTKKNSSEGYTTQCEGNNVITNERAAQVILLSINKLSVSIVL